jgi:hypothetical protein
MHFTTIPVLPMVNKKETILFYESRLGFISQDQGNYLVMKKGTAEIHFFTHTDKYLCANSRCVIKVSNIQDLYSDLCAEDIIELEGRLKDQHGGIKRFTITDNNGNTLQFEE